MASSVTLPGTSASIVTARLMQSADWEHMSLANSYVPGCSLILSMELSLTAAISALVEPMLGGEDGGGGVRGGDDGCGVGEGRGGGSAGEPPQTSYTLSPQAISTWLVAALKKVPGP